jgi:hypothetical protein
LQREDLRADAVPAPGAPGQYWLLYRHKTELTMTESEIVCPLLQEVRDVLVQESRPWGLCRADAAHGPSKGLMAGS